MKDEESENALPTLTFKFTWLYFLEDEEAVNDLGGAKAYAKSFAFNMIAKKFASFSTWDSVLRVPMGGFTSTEEKTRPNVSEMGEWKAYRASLGRALSF